MSPRYSPLFVAIAATISLNSALAADQIIDTPISVTKDNGPVTYDGTNIVINVNDQSVYDAVTASHEGCVTIGGSNTNSVVINSNTKDGGDAVSALTPSEPSYNNLVEIIANNSVEINSSNTAIWVQSNTQNESGNPNTGNSSEVRIEADRIILHSKSSTINAFSNGKVNLKGNYIEIVSDNGNGTAIDVRGYSTVNIGNDARNGTVVIRGDIGFETPGPYDGKSGSIIDAYVNIDLSGPESKWEGNVYAEYPTRAESSGNKDLVSSSHLNITLANGAAWTPRTITEETREHKDGYTLEVKKQALNNLTLNDGVINLTEGTDQQVKIENLKGTGGTINAEATKDDDGNFVSSTVWIDEVSNTDGSTPSMTVKYTGITADDLSDVASDMKSLADQTIKVGEDGTGTRDAVDQTFNVEEGNIRGAVTSGYDADGNLSTHQAKNVKLTDYGALNSMTFVQWRNEINHLTKRLGDIRASESSIGAWARVYGGESQWKSNSEIEMDHTTIQVGADYRINNHWIVGGAFSYTDSDADLVKGQAKGDSYSLAAYATYMADGGSYLDLIARYGYLDNEMTSGNMSVDTQSNAFSLSVETGHMFRIMEQAYIEPQIEVTYGFISGDDATASNGVRLDQDDFQSLITRVGVRTGFEFPEKAGTIYAMLSYSYDFLGDADGTAAQGGLREALNEDLGGGWVSYGIGAQFKLGDNAFAYGELERTSGGEIDNPYLFNVGFRWNF